MITTLKRIMLIDDDPIVNLLNQTLITSIHPAITICAFTSAEEALYRLSEASEKTLLLLDLNMPRFDGWDFLDAFSSMPGNVKTQFYIYVLSSSIDEADRKRALEYPDVRDYLVKPLLMPILLSTLEQSGPQHVDVDQAPA